MLMDLEVRHLRLVSAVAELGSLTRAGDRLHLTQSALSHQLRDIESRLGAALFLRVGKRLVLTPAGERLLATARDVLDRLDRTEQDIHQMGKARAGMLRLTTECYTCYHWLPALLVRYRQRFPQVEVRIDVGATGRPLDMLLAGKLDLAIMSTPVRDRRLVSRPVFDDELVVVAARDHRFAKQTHVRLSDLRDETLYVYPPKQESRVLQEVLVPSGHVPARVEEVMLTESIAELVKAGLGVSVLARWAVQPLVDAGSIVTRPLTARGLRRQWRAVMLKDLAGADYIGEFIELLGKHAPTARASRKPA
ncbi:MAG TPA: LysR substrate-binding domain-containing protein [Vicinamibacterales bacterium]|nr:LysR substrate-binding domain-containing protein [Vicinamibacterales bacterium]